MGANNSSIVPIDALNGVHYRIVSNDKREFKVSELALQQSETLKTLVESMDYSKEEFKTHPIPIDNCDGATLALVFQWCEHHKGEPVPVDDGIVPKKTKIPDFDAKLMNINNDALLNLMVAASNLKIHQLINVTGKKVAMMIEGKSPEEIRHIYGIPSDEEDKAAERAAMCSGQPNSSA